MADEGQDKAEFVFEDDYFDAFQKGTQ